MSDAAAIVEAAEILDRVAVRTPLLECPILNERIGGRLLVKAEPLQCTGSFKFRGAYNRLAHMSTSERRRGVVAYSSGNHAQGVAAAARMLDVRAVIVMPSDAPEVKISGTREWGADIVFYDRKRERREEIAATLAARNGATLIKPYDDPLIIAGQGTIGLELAAQAAEMGVKLDAVLVPCSGGGLSAGVALALADRSSASRIFAVEPDGFDDTKRSLAARTRLANPSSGQSICDALMVAEPGEITFPINLDLLAGGISVPDEVTMQAMVIAFTHFKLVVEPGGAVALAAAIAPCAEIRGKTSAVICSGGNVDPQLFRRALKRI